MANCPKCGRKLHWSDWRPECPDCHVNMIYYKSNERLLEETEKAEIEHAEFQPKVDRAKAATIGQKKSIVRMILFLIPAAALFLPIFSITVSGIKTNYNVLDLYSIATVLDIKKLLSDISVIDIAIVLCVLAAALGIVFTALQIAAGNKKGIRRNIIYSCVSLALAAASLICIICFSGSPADDYSKLILNEEEYVYINGNQENVDRAVQKIRDIFDDKTVDTGLLEKAVESGIAALEDPAGRGYDDEQKAALEKSVNDAKNLLLNESATIDDIRNAAAAVNSAVNAYNDLETAVKYASLAVNDGSISEKSFNSLTDSIEDGRKILKTLAEGGSIVNMKTRDKKQIEEAEKIKLAEATVSINSRLSSLVDISVLEQLNKRFSESVDNGEALTADIRASIGAGIIVFIVLIAVQLAFNIFFSRKDFEVKYTQCYIGGLPSEEYFRYVEQGMSRDEIYRKMLTALAELQDEAEKSLKGRENNGEAQ